MLSNFSIIMLLKQKYNTRYINKDVDETPRLLIIKVIDSAKQYIIRYPDGNTERINQDYIRANAIYEPDHIRYAEVATRMPAVEQEFRRNEPFRTFLSNVLPTLYMSIEQKVEAKNQAMYEHSKAEPITIKDIVPVLPVISEAVSTPLPTISPTLQVLLSIDHTLKELLNLWKDGGK